MSDITINLLVTNAEIEALTGINAANDKYMMPACVLAHTEGLCDIIGEPLFDAICADVSNADSTLLLKIKKYLIYETARNYAFMTTNKLSNMGVVQTQDGTLQTNSTSEIRAESWWQARADKVAREIQIYIINNISTYRTYIDEAAEAGMHANLKSAATCGVWLGGYRGVRR